MREEQWILIDNLKRKIFIKYELKKLICNSIIKNNSVKNTHKYFALYTKNKINRWATLNEQNNRCFKSGRHWYTNKLTRTSRFVFRIESYSGHLPGFKRASW